MPQLPENLPGPANPLRVANAAEMAALEIGPEALSDDAIRQAVVDALGRDLLVWSFDFNVNVRHGRVYVYGRVDGRAERERVHEVVTQAPGVCAVDNQVEESGQQEAGHPLPAFQSAPPPHSSLPTPALPTTADQELAARIRQRHFCSPALHHQQVEVRVQHGQVTLTGTVANWLDRQEAGLDAYEAGARDVRNHLSVRADHGRQPGAATSAASYSFRRAC